MKCMKQLLYTVCTVYINVCSSYKYNMNFWVLKCCQLVEVLPSGSALDAALLTRRRQEVLGPGAPGAPGVRASRWDGDGVPDLDRGDWDLSICREVRQVIQKKQQQQHVAYYTRALLYYFYLFTSESVTFLLISMKNNCSWWYWHSYCSDRD